MNFVESLYLLLLTYLLIKPRSYLRQRRKSRSQTNLQFSQVDMTRDNKKNDFGLSLSPIHR